MKTILTVSFLLLASGLWSQENTSENNSQTLNCQLVEKPFINKAGNVSENKELYLRCSVQDYYIKLCESDVAQDVLTPHLNEGVAVEVEIREGNWDICPGDPEQMQSRVGKYAVILSIED